MIDPKTLPQEPGVYLFKDGEGNIIYVGKAKNLRARVRSYFSGNDHSAKTIVLVRQIRDCETIVVHNEVEALLLENKLIKQHKPKYNINLKDAKTYAYIKITDEKYPRILSTRRVTKKGEYFGPYTDGTARHEVVQLAVKLFQLRTCKTLPKRACLNYHIGLCTAPCTHNVSDEEYAQQVEHAREFLKGKTKPVINRLEKEMQRASHSQKYEVALEKRRQLDAVTVLDKRQSVDTIQRFDQDVIALEQGEKHAIIALFSIKKGVISGKKEFTFEFSEGLLAEFIKLYYSENYVPSELIVSEEFWEDTQEREAIEEYLARIKGAHVHITHPQRGQKRRLIELALKNAVIEDESLIAIKEELNLPQVPSIIECFDISNLGSEDIVCGMTRFVHGRADKRGYRKFKIRTTSGQDDFAAMHEAVLRRYTRLLNENRPMPNLILIDGGKGQLGAALNALRKLSLQLPIIALAKREEEIYLPEEDEPRLIDKSSSMMLLLRRVRDETHRFAITYQKKRREIKFREETR